MNNQNAHFPPLPFPFNPYAEWNKTQIQIWYEQVRVEPNLMQLYDGSTPTIIYGPSGSGITTTLWLIEKYERERGNFVVDWVPQEDAFKSAVQCIIETIARELVKRSNTIRNHIQTQPPMEENALGIWFWLLTTYLYKGDQTLSFKWFERYLKIADCRPYEKFTSDTQSPNAFVILFWLIEVIHAMGYQDIVCLSDRITEVTVGYVQTWFRDPILQDHLGILGISGLNHQFISLFQSNARIQRLRLAWEWDTLWQICARMVTAALQLESMVEISDHLKTELTALVTQELGQTPQGVKVLAITLYWLHQKYGIIPDTIAVIKRDLYERGIRLSYDSEQKIVYRGIAPLKGLKDLQLQVFEYLYQRRTQIVTRKELCKRFEIKSPYLDKLISRIRQVIEPDFQEKGRKRWVYLLNEHSWGYILRV